MILRVADFFAMDARAARAKGRLVPQRRMNASCAWLGKPVRLLFAGPGSRVKG
jgi:hypothetical protein